MATKNTGAVMARLKAFRVVKATIEAEGDWPTGAALAKALGVSETVAFAHLRALEGATGLGMARPPARKRTQQAIIERDSKDRTASYQTGSLRRWGTADPGAPVPIDVLIAGRKG